MSTSDRRRVLFHISPNAYPPLPATHHTRRIWTELAKGFDEYHILARSQTNHPSTTREGNLVLHLVPRLTRKSRWFFFTSFYLLVLARRHGATHILCQCPVLGGGVAVLAKRLWAIPVMVEIHGDVYFSYLHKQTLGSLVPRLLTIFALRNATKVRSLSSAMSRDLAEAKFGRNIVLVPNRVDTRLFDKPKEEFRLGKPMTILGIGRFVEQKGFDVAINALRLLRGVLDARLVLVGGGPLRDRFEEMSAGLPVQFIDWVEQSVLRDLMQRADIYIQPSKPWLGEAMPRTILEAMAMRLPIVSTRVAAIPGVLRDGENAVLVDPGSPAVLAAALVRLASDEGLRRAIAERAYADVLEEYNWERVFALYRNEIVSMD